MSFLLVMKAEIVRTLIIMRRYWFRTLTGIVIGYGMLVMLILGFTTIQSSQDADDGANGKTPIELRQEQAAKASGGIIKVDDPEQTTEWVLGFIVGMFAFGIVGLFSQGLQEMARTGVLEQLCMSPHGLITNFLARTVVGSISTIISSSILVWLVAWTFAGQLHFQMVPVFALLGLTFINLLGFGFMVGGLVLVFKQVGQVAILVRMGLFFLAMLAREELVKGGDAIGEKLLAWFMHALPITDAAICLKYVLIKNQGIVTETVNGVVVNNTDAFMSVFSHSSFYWLLGNCVVWTLLGVGSFKIMENWSRDKGTLGAY